MDSVTALSTKEPSHQPIECNKPTVICLPSDPDNDDFGIELTGGCHSYMGEVCVCKVYTDSVSYRDGRLKRGDVLLSVNGKSMKKCSLEEARSAVANSPHTLQLVVRRDPDPLTLFTSIEEPKIFITVELWRTHINEPLGISLMERKYVYITVMHVFISNYSCKLTWLSLIDVFGRIVSFPGTSVSSSPG
ncbi:hypothetical protein RvY_13788-2 [Ramazzottius varieornatus]|uniref:PDZ domain-containing protein n=1 Tax=Ramazzottius varieornatus TaxID=947166 RepID=A0A1D1VXL2_RAMVA|nr:hypothetical protein RvY_13788-2 [Ramazzottius varieornatus]